MSKRRQRLLWAGLLATLGGYAVLQYVAEWHRILPGDSARWEVRERAWAGVTSIRHSSWREYWAEHPTLRDWHITGWLLIIAGAALSSRIVIAEIGRRLESRSTA